MEIKFPDDIIKHVTKRNWEKYYDEYMVVSTKEGKEYVWDTEIMKDFIRKLVV